MFHGVPLGAATTTWDAGSGTDALWSTLTNWSGDGEPTANDDVVFPYLMPGALSDPSVILLGPNEIARSLRFRNSYALRMSDPSSLLGDLTVSTGEITVDLASTALIDARLRQSSGLTLGTATTSGRGALRLTNLTNSYTGPTTINFGSLIVTGSGALGAGTSTIVVNGSSTLGTGGGALVLDGINGNTGIGLVLNRNLSLTGFGPSNDGAALVSVGNNSITGSLTIGGAANTRIQSVFGMLTVGNLDIGTSAGSRITSFTGYGNATITGVLTGSGVIDRVAGNNGAGTLILSPSDASGFTGQVRTSGGSVRITSGAAVGKTFGIGVSSAISINTGILEVRSDATDAAGRAYFGNDILIATTQGGNTVFLDRAVGGGGIGVTVEFDTLYYPHNTPITFTGRNGYGLEFAASGNTNPTIGIRSIINNNLNGLFVINGDHWDGLNGANTTYFQIYGSGDALITGSLVTTGTQNTFSKSGTGKLTLLGTNSLYSGESQLGGGTLAITNFGALNNAAGSGAITFMTAMNDLEFIGHDQAADLTTNKGINLAISAKITASQTGSSGPVVITATPVVTGAAKTLYLGGVNTLENLFSGAIGDASGGVTSLAKVDAGSWLLSGPNTYLGATTVSGGTLKLLADGATSSIIADASSIIFATNGFSGDQSAGGTFEFINRTGSASLETVGLLVPTAGAATVKLTSSSGTANLRFSGVGTRTAGATLNFVPGSGTISFASFTQPAGGLYDARAYATINGLDWASVNGSNQVVAAADGGPLPAAVGNSLTNYVDTRATVATDSSSTIVIGSLKLAAPSEGQSIVIGGQLTLTGGGLLFDDSLGAATIDGGSINTPTFVYNATTTANSATVNLTSGSTAGFYVGMPVTGNSRIPAGATVASIVGATQFTLSIATGVTAGTSQPSTFGNELVIIVNGSNSANALTINSVLDSANGTLTKAGTGTLILGGWNAYLGNTVINEGILKLAGAGRLGTVTPANVTTIRQDGTLDLNGIAANTGYLSGAGRITNSGASPVTLTAGISSSTATGTFSGVIQDGLGQLSYMQSGTATAVQALIGMNTYTGSTTLNGGVLQVDVLDVQRITSLESTLTAGSTIVATASTAGLVPGTPVSGPGIVAGSTIERILSETSYVISKPATKTAFVTLGFTPFSSLGTSSSDAANLIFNGGVLQYTGSNTTFVQATQTRSVSIDRLFTLAGNATIQSQGTYGNVVATASANHAALVFNNTGTVAFLGTGTRTLTLNGSSSGDNEIALKLIDNPNGPAGAGSALSVTKDGTGQWVLTNTTSNYSGATTITAGVLAAEASVIPDTSPIVLNGGILQTSGTFTRSLATSAVVGFGTINWGTNVGGGFAASIDKLVVNVGGAVTPSTLYWNTGGFVNGTNGALLLSSGTALAEVDIINTIDLGASTRNTARTVTVADNTSTYTDFATISGAMVGTGSLTKNGAGTLQLLGSNTYTGTTTISTGTLVVAKLGNTSEIDGSSSVGLTTEANLAASAVIFGSGTTLIYTGAGEVSDRYLQLNGAGSSIIVADGSGPLTLTNVQTAASGAKTLNLRGLNTQGNKITNVIGDTGGATTVNHDAAGTWILAGANTYSGTTTLSAGMLGLGSDSVGNASSITSGSIGRGALAMTNSTLFAYGGPRTIYNNLTVTTAAAFVGDHGITLGGTLTGSAITITNSITAGSRLTINAAGYVGTITFNGSGDTTFNSAITGASIVTYSGTGSLTLGSAANAYTGATTISSGTLKLGSSNVVPDAGAFNFTPAFGTSAVLDLNGFNDTITAFTTTNSFGSALVDNSSSGASTLTFGSATATTNSIGITTSGTGSLSINKVGIAVFTLAKGPFSYSGVTTVSAGGLTFLNDVSRTAGIVVSGNGSLSFPSGFSAASSTSRLNIAGGSTLSFVNGIGQPSSQVSSLILGTAATTTTLQLDVGAVSDTIRYTGSAAPSISGNIVFNLQPIAGFGDVADIYDGFNGFDSSSGSFYYTLLSSPVGGLNGATYSLGTLFSVASLTGIVPGSASITQPSTAAETSVQLQFNATPAGTLYWKSTSDASWSANVTGTRNWSSLADRSIEATGTPGINNKVAFNITTGSLTTLTSSLNGYFTIQGLDFTQSRPVTIAAGTPTTSQLTLAPPAETNGSPGVGLNVAAGSGKVTITANLLLGTDQVWNVAAATQILDVSAFGGKGTLTKTGLGMLRINAAGLATPATAGLIINAGIVESQGTAFLGTVAAGTAIPITINTGGRFQMNNYTAGNAPHNVESAITLNGGTLAGGGLAKNYSGRINVTADSTISLVNVGVTTANPYQMHIPNVVSGAGKITFEGTTDFTNGNRITGTLFLGATSAGNTNWSGGMQLNGGSIYLRNLFAQGTGPINASFGRLVFDSGTSGTLSDIDQTITIDGTDLTAVLEIAVDNATTSPVNVYTVALSKIVMGGSGTAPYLRLNQADAFSLLSIKTIELKADSRISFAGAAGIPAVGAPTTVVSGAITGDYRLFLNTDSSWGQTNFQTLRLEGVNTFNGGLTLGGGVLEFGADANLGAATGEIVLGGGTLRFITDSATKSLTMNRPFVIIDTPAERDGTIEVTTGHRLALSGPIDGWDSTLAKTGGGTLVLTNGASPFTGLLRVDQGTLVGEGALDADVSIAAGAIFSPGVDGTQAAEGIGTFAVDSLTLHAGSTFSFQFTRMFNDGVDPTGHAGIDWDLIRIGSQLTLDGVVKLQVKSVGTGFDYSQSSSWLFAEFANDTPGHIFDLNSQPIDASGVSSHFYVDVTGVAGIPANGSFYITTADDGLYLNYAAVPEPGSLALIGVAGLGLAIHRRRRTGRRRHAEGSGD